MELNISERDYFAGQALPFALSLGYGNDWGNMGDKHKVYAARKAYSIADAMLEERKVKHATRNETTY